MTGWLGSGFDCGDCACDCPCSFEAYWGYDDESIVTSEECLLGFLIGNVQSECASVPYEDADITVVLKVNGTVISEDLFPVSSTVITGGGAGWQRWKPTAGDVYTAEITLHCGEETVTDTITYTIPDPANTSCNCCSDHVPDYVTISGLTGVFAIMNGTWSLSSIGGCVYAAGPTSGAADPADPCFGGTQLYTCSNVNNYYYYPDKTRFPAVTVTMPGTSGNVVIEFGASYNVWRYRPAFVDCSNTSAGSCAFSAILWRYEISCNNGTATLITRTEAGGSGYTGLVSGVPDPTVTLTMV